MRHPKFTLVASISALAFLSPLACAGPEEQSGSTLQQPRAALEAETDDGTRITATPVGETQCGGANGPIVNFSGLVTTTGAVDSVVLTASIDGAAAVPVGEIASQDFIHRGRFKDAPYTASVLVPEGEHQVTLCFVQSGADGREQKQVCADAVAVSVDCPDQGGGDGQTDGGSGGGGDGQTDGGSGGGGGGGGDEGPKDELPPVTVLAASPLANAAGWNNTDIVAQLNATDDVSGVKEIRWVLQGAESAQGVTPGDVAFVPLHNEGITTITYYAVDNAGNVEAPHVAAFRIDKTAPVIAFAAQVPAANGYGWNNTGVAVAFGVSDALSGVEGSSPSSPLVFSGEGAGQSAVVSAVDVAGNVASATSPAVNIDMTAPVITFGEQSPAANGAGWNNTDVSFPYTTTDALSGVASATPGSPVVITGEGSGLTATVTAVDFADNVSTAVTPAVNIDRTPPVIIGIPSTCTLWPPNHKLVLVATLSGQDSTSGFDSASWNIQGVSSEPENDKGDGNTVGDISIVGTSISLRAERSGTGTGRTYTITASAQDAAGNTANGSFVCTVPHDQRKR